MVFATFFNLQKKQQKRWGKEDNCNMRNSSPYLQRSIPYHLIEAQEDTWKLVEPKSCFVSGAPAPESLLDTQNSRQVRNNINIFNYLLHHTCQ